MGTHPACTELEKVEIRDALGGSPQALADGDWWRRTPAPSRLVWDNAEVLVLRRLPQSPSSTMLSCLGDSCWTTSSSSASSPSLSSPRLSSPLPYLCFRGSISKQGIRTQHRVAGSRSGDTNDDGAFPQIRKQMQRRSTVSPLFSG